MQSENGKLNAKCVLKIQKMRRLFLLLQEASVKKQAKKLTQIRRSGKKGKSSRSH